MIPSVKCINLIKSFEAFCPLPYRCPAGKMTIGYGHVMLDSEDWSWALKQGGLTEPQGLQLLASDIGDKVWSLLPLLKRQPTQGQFDAMVSLVFNTGTGIADGKKGDFADSTLLAAFNAGDTKTAAEEFLKWNKFRSPNTGALIVSNGLTRRRMKEKALFLEQS